MFLLKGQWWVLGLLLNQLTEKPAYILDLVFVGTKFFGWQSQADGNTIQDAVEGALKTFLREETKVQGSSRTDSGVHAESFIAVFKTTASYDEAKWLKSLSALLPNDISVRSVKSMPENFHPIRSAKAKAYRYRLWTSSISHPMVAPFVWQVFPDVNLIEIQKTLTQFIGRHDFTSFSAADSSAKTFERTILDIQIVQSGNLVDIWFLGEGFLKQMIRTLVGTAVEVGLDKRKSDEISNIFSAKDRTKAGQTAPAQGLSLIRVFYDKIPTLQTLAAEASQGFSLSVL